jgi:CRISPR-associated protein Csb2
MFLNIHVTFTARLYHGIEWPPSPARLFQALVAATHRGAHGLVHAKVRDRALEWLERLEAPIIFAPPATTSQSEIVGYVPNNDDGEPKDRLLHVKAAKAVRRYDLAADTTITYGWNFPPTDGAAGNADVVSAMANLVTYLGRTVDQVYARSEVAEAASNPSTRAVVWMPTETSDGDWESPKAGFLGLCQGRYPRSVSEEPPDFTNSRRVDYSSGERPKSSAPIAVVELLKADGDYHRFNPQSLRVPAGMVRDAFQTWLADCPSMEKYYGPDRVARLLFGHKSASSGAPSEGGHIATVPIPSLNSAHTADGLVRRVLLIGWGIRDLDDQDLYAQAVEGLNGRALRDRGREVGELRLVPKKDQMAHYNRWLGKSPSGTRAWRSVTPVVLPGYARKSRSCESYIMRALVQQGFAAETVDSVASFSGPLVPGTFPAREYRVADYLRTTPRVHAEIIFKQPTSGPLVVGRGRFAGLGLFAPFDPGFGDCAPDRNTVEL